jgi:hypothetical protein
MTFTHVPEPIRVDETASIAEGDRLRWHGRDVEVVQIVEITPGYAQAVLRVCDRPQAPPISIPLMDLIAGVSD